MGDRKPLTQRTHQLGFVVPADKPVSLLSDGSSSQLRWWEGWGGITFLRICDPPVSSDSEPLEAMRSGWEGKPQQLTGDSGSPDLMICPPHHQHEGLKTRD